MRAVFYSTKFKKDVRLASKRGLSMSIIRTVMKNIENDIELESKYKEHILTGKYAGYSECHLQPDWLLVYLLAEGKVTFARTGTHADLFR